MAKKVHKAKTAQPAIILECGPLVIDRLRRRVVLDGEELILPWNLYLMLEFFVLHKGEILTWEQIVAGAWNNSEAKWETFGTQLHRLRIRLGAAGDLIANVRGEGYVLKENDQ